MPKRSARKMQALVAKKTGKEVPRRVRRRNRKPVKDHDIVAVASGAHGTDVRAPAHTRKRIGEQPFAVSSQDPTLNVIAPIYYRPLAYLAMGIVLRAIKHGWGGGVGASDKIPYYAWRYLFDAFVSALNGAVPALQSAPLWLWEIFAALNPKTESFKTGRIVYTGNAVDDGEGLEVEFQLGLVSEAYSIFWGIPGSATVNGFNVLEPPAAPYSADLGQASVQSMFDYYEGTGMNKRMTPPDPSQLIMTHDTSAFSPVYSEEGASFFSPCGAANEIFSERQIHSPLFAKFVFYQDTGVNEDYLWRGFHQIRKGGMGSSYIGPRMSEMSLSREIHNKCPPILKFVNFDEIYESLALTIGAAQDAIAYAAGPNYQTCPLTVLQVQTILRQTLMPLFDNDIAQEIRLQPLSFLTFLPFVCGPNGVSQGAVGTGMLLPQLLAENIRALKRSTSTLNNQVGGDLVLDMIPVLGRPPGLAQLGNYRNSFGVDIFAVDPAEIPMNLIDCSVVQGGVTSYLSPSGKGLAILIEAWNSWIKSLEGALLPLVNLSTSPGISVLGSLIYTNHYRYAPNNLEQLAPAPSSTSDKKEIVAVSDKARSPPPYPKDSALPFKNKKNTAVGSDLTKLRAGTPGPSPGSSYFGNTALSSTTAQLGFSSPLLKYVGAWILPCSFTDAPNRQSGMSIWQSNNVEPFSLASSAVYTSSQVTSTQNQFPTMFDRHLQLALMNVRSYNATSPSEIQIELDDLARKGRGGWLGNLAGVILDGVGLKGAGDVARNVGNVLGL